ncbi:small ribosomal subunit biogenesis GTPase RsgA [Waterburya agarophytonicola K14]|uniref:Small ribosomal subunit biogenesis GTPase RsgA n=1 Tax=Waterburya agarophytonicola KI4 TaxID=2874699 RepID=A0A964BMT6_9CYAN|nr:small ribosomal subunit biogenesis GTPase RsgA [Waterburya agarophytonicola KI4]
MVDHDLIGTVVAVQANFYQVCLENNSTQFLLCTRRTRLKKIGQKVMVGDRVIVEEPDWQDSRGAIAQVLPRTTELERPPVANADIILLVFAVEEPALDPWQLSRFLVKAESTTLELCLCLNKCDLITVEQRQQWQGRLKQWGYDASYVSVIQQQGINRLWERLQGKITVVAGPSGVGKSSLIRTLIPTIDLRVGKVSGKLQRGRHTTRHVELFELPGGGLLADSPGFNQPDLDCLPRDLARYFPEARIRLQKATCQFSNCLHKDEPNCVVRGDWERYEYYLDFLDKAIALQEILQKQPDRESNLKLMVKRSGKSQYEPKLQTKKYRRTNRKTKHQNLQDIYETQLQEETEDS